MTVEICFVMFMFPFIYICEDVWKKSIVKTKLNQKFKKKKKKDVNHVIQCNLSNF